MGALAPGSPGGPPLRVGRYDVLLPIGVGGMASVYLARTEVVPGVHRLVALKMMHPHLSGGEGNGALSLVQEARLAAGIRNPNVVLIYEAMDGPEGVYMVMDYVEGDTLSGLIRSAIAAGERIPLPIAGRVLLDAFSGLHAAHELRDNQGHVVNLVHRDFSPSNILVGEDGITRLADFGVAKAESVVSATTTGVIKGKLGYMAPEQVLGLDLDRRCDVWAAGVVLWEVLANRRMHAAADAATMRRILEEDPPSLQSARPDIPASLVEVVASALARKREERCPTAAELRSRLQRALAAIGPIADAHEVGEYVRVRVGDKLESRRASIQSAIAERAEPPTVATVATVTAPRRRRPVVWAALLVAAAVGGSVTLARAKWARTQPPSERADPNAVSTASAATELAPASSSSAIASSSSSEPTQPPVASASPPPPSRSPHPSRPAVQHRPTPPSDPAPNLAPSPYGNR